MATHRMLVFAALLAGTHPAAAQQKPPIIDMHMHAGSPHLSTAELRPCSPWEFCLRSGPAAREGDDLLKASLAAMRRHNVVLAFLSDSPESLDAWVRAAPGRFIASPLVSDPAKVDVAALRKAYENGRFGGLGELATQYEGFAPNDPRLDPLFALAEEFDLPILIHCTGTAGPSGKFLIANGHPQLLQEVLLKHPRLRLWMENAGFPFLDETIALMYRYPNVYADLSTMTWIDPRPMFNRYLRGLIDAGLAKRLMFGSDQMQWPETIDSAVEAIDSADFLTPQQKRDIFYNNAARFLRLTKQERGSKGW